MPLDRVLKNLSIKGVPDGSPGTIKGDIVDSSKFKHRDILIARKALAPVSTPPLVELPGWSKRAYKLEDIGIISVQDFIDADDKVIAKKFGYKTTSAVVKWKAEAIEWLKPKPVKRGG